MATEHLDDQLHLANLLISNFRGIEDLSLSRLGRVTLLAGNNSVGKTTILDAIQIFAARGRFPVLRQVLADREEFHTVTDGDGDSILEPDCTALFFSQDSTMRQRISIGSSQIEDQLRMEMTSLDDKQIERLERILPSAVPGASMQGLKTSFGGKEQITPWIVTQEETRTAPNAKGTWYHLNYREMSRLLKKDEPLPAIKCVSLGTGLIEDDVLSQFWDKVLLTLDEDHAIQALSLIFGDNIERVAVIGGDSVLFREERLIRRLRWSGGDRFIVKLKDSGQLVPLKRLGDGALRLFSIALALANSRDGILLIDEVENGIHYSIQRMFWNMVLKTARKNNVQVLATTHSWDCITGFAYAANDNTDIDGLLIRLDKDEYGFRTTEYSEEELLTAVQQDIEVR